MEDYVGGFLARAVDFVRRRHDRVGERGVPLGEPIAGGVGPSQGPTDNRPKLHLIGYCMGGTFAAMHAALDPESVETLTLLAAPVDFGGRESLLNLWTENQ